MSSILLSEERIQARVRELGAAISATYRDKQPFLMVGVLRGAAPFFADLLRSITVPVSIDFMSISSYTTPAPSSGAVRIIKDLDHPIAGKHVLLVEDIIDTGLTLRYIRKNLLLRHPSSLGVCVLLDRPKRRLVEMSIDHVGFEIPDEYVVGYGLDHRQLYRNLPFVTLWDHSEE
ncbi:MAG: hypoxanthine phosphoribosyltransferase [Chloroflexota bacterium]|nr:MAG: hypoxanthine phosphoribosyltransferase [Chloroflexota bacterium]